MSEKRAKGVLGITRNSTNDKTILFPLCIEGEKEEMVRGFDVLSQKLACNMLELVSGAVDSEDVDDFSALRRELFEERGIGGKVLLTPLSNTLEVSQWRGGRELDFLVSMFMIRLSEEQQADLAGRYQSKIIGDEYLTSNLDMIKTDEFRPLARAALQLAVKHNYWKQS